MTELTPTLLAALLSGLLGSAHCVGMCAGISGLFAAGAAKADVRSKRSLALSYNLGRILSYAFLGASLALLGKGAIDWMPRLATPVRFMGGALIVLIGLQVAFRWRLLAVAERPGAMLWQKLAPITRRFVPADSVPKAVGLGLLWGWLPCGLVYAALLLALSTASPLQGAAVMAAFGMGTAPAMLLTGLGAYRLSQFMAHNQVSAGLLIVILGLLTLTLPALHLLDRDVGHPHDVHTTD